MPAHPRGTPIFANRTAEEQVLSAALRAEDHFFQARDIANWKDFYYEDLKAVAQALWRSAEHRHSTNIADVEQTLIELGALGVTVTLATLQRLDDRALPSIASRVQENARIVRSHAARRQAIELLRDQGEALLDESQALDSVLNGLTEQSQQLMQGNTADYDPSVESWLNAPQTAAAMMGIPTRMAWVNRAAKGLGKARLHVIHTSPKGGKTTLYRNMILKPLLDGIPMSIFSVDGTKSDIGHGLQAQIATEHLYRHNAPEFVDVNGQEVRQYTISEDWIPVENRIGDQHEAMVWSEEQLRGKPLSIYDSQSNFMHIPTLMSFLRRDRIRYGVEIVVVDYVQQLYTGVPQTSWDTSNFEVAVRTLLQFCTREQITMIILDQPNETEERGQSGRSSGSKGGGALWQAADFWWTPHRNPTMTDATQMNVSLKGRKVDYATVSYKIEPFSGLIEPPSSRIIPVR
jgi:replicative DNA helicase